MSYRNVRVRFAPSPTGNLHIGGVRTALFNYIFAKKYNGKFLLRIEDTDKERSKDKYIDVIIESLQWLGLKYDEEPVFQSKRLELYKTYAQKLVDEGKAYYCYCTQEELEKEKNKAKDKKIPYKYSGKCRKFMGKGILKKPYTIRILNNEEKNLIFNDIIRGNIETNTKEFDDFIIIKSDGMPTYNFACVIDDHLMNISHVLRGEDHITNTFKQLLIYDKMNWKPPIYGHLPLINGADGKRLSKRHGATSLLEFREMGYIKEALINYLMLLGWNPGTNEEIFDIEYIKNNFEIEKISKKPAQFDYKKLNWINGEYLYNMDLDKKTSIMLEYLLKYHEKEIPKDRLKKALNILGPRGKTLKEIWDYISFFFDEINTYEAHIKCEYKNELLKILEQVEFTEKKLEEKLRAFAKEHNKGFGKIAKYIRMAISGKKITPGLFESMTILGKEKTIERIRRYE